MLFRAALEGISANLAWGAEHLSAAGLTLTRLRLVGGGAANELWRTILAASLQLPLERCAEPESAALGAALQSLWTTRRATDPTLTADESCAPHVRLTGELEHPDSALLGPYSAFALRFQAAVRSRLAPRV